MVGNHSVKLTISLDNETPALDRVGWVSLSSSTSQRCGNLWGNYTNQAPSDVSKMLDGSTYPRRKLGCRLLFKPLRILFY